MHPTKPTISNVTVNQMNFFKNGKLITATYCQAPGPLLGPGQGPGQGPRPGPCQGPRQGQGQGQGQGPGQGP